MNKKYAMGIDFGTQSGRVLLVETDTGREVAIVAKEYSHGVMDVCLPDGTTELGMDWALQHPQDYIEVLGEAIPQALATARIDAADVVGVGIDFTSCSMLPLDESGYPLSFRDEYVSSPHAYVKLWKHHAAQEEANAINRIAEEYGEGSLAYHGGSVSSESLIPKIWQVLNEAPEVYQKTDKFMEAGDWIVMLLTGEEKRSNCMAGFKSLWNRQEGHPHASFFRALDPGLEDLVDAKLGHDYYPVGSKAGEVTPAAAKLTGLKAGTAVAVACPDAHAALPAVGITKPGKLLLIIGTSTCHIVLDAERKYVPGSCGMVEDGVIPGYFVYEAGQCCVGDSFEWFVDNCVPEAYGIEAVEKGLSIYELLTDKASRLGAGTSGLLALDWWNGNRSILANANLTGMIVGYSLLTRPEEVYRALVESTAYGTRMIIENYRRSGLRIDEICAAGGISQKNPLVMQLYADVLNSRVKVSSSSQASALGAAIFGAVAAGQANGGYDSINDAVTAMVKPSEKCYLPSPENVRIYDQLYYEYRTLHDYFGRGGSDVMARLKMIKTEANLLANTSRT